MDNYLLSAIVVISVTTFTLRALPFIIFKKKPNQYLLNLSAALSYGIIGMLIVYSLKDTDISSGRYGLPELISLLFVVVSFKLRHNTLLSIFGGTILYMILIQTILT